MAFLLYSADVTGYTDCVSDAETTLSWHKLQLHVT